MKDRSPSQVFSVRDAAYHTVREYPGGARSLGPRVGIEGAYLSQQVNPNNIGKKGLDIDTAVQIQHLSQDYRILHAMALELGHVCVKQTDDDTDQQKEQPNVMESIGYTVSEFGEFIASVTEAIKDGKVTNRELRDVNKQLGELTTATNQLRGLLGAMNDKLNEIAPKGCFEEDTVDTATFGLRSVVSSKR
jgi:hypothetical protein